MFHCISSCIICHLLYFSNLCDFVLSGSLLGSIIITGFLEIDSDSTSYNGKFHLFTLVVITDIFRLSSTFFFFYLILLGLIDSLYSLLLSDVFELQFLHI